MRRYKLLTTEDLIPNNKYDAVLCYPYPSPSTAKFIEPIYFDEFGQWCGTDKEIIEVVDESVLDVLLNYNPKRAKEIIQGGYEEDYKYTNLLSIYDYRLGERV